MTNSQNTHTPGPWIVYMADDKAHPYILQDDQRRPSKVIAIVLDDDYTACPANAALLAAAPDLLDALENLFENCVMIHKYGGEIDNTAQADAAIAAARRAIAKATSE